jgi:flagellar hook-basal body complex protein FliE
MVPVAQAAMSLFGGSLNRVASPVANPVANAGSDLTGLSGANGAQAAMVSAGGISDAAAPAPFADLLVDTVGQVQGLEGEARSKIEGLISGKGVDVHEAMIAAQKAGMGFELVLSLRNKALSAYQQVMGMQF